jgi:hypothetical protein
MRNTVANTDYKLWLGLSSLGKVRVERHHSSHTRTLAVIELARGQRLVNRQKQKINQ